MRRSVYCTASFLVCSRRRTELPIIYADFRLDYKLATLPFCPLSRLAPSDRDLPTLVPSSMPLDRLNVLVDNAALMQLADSDPAKGG